MLDSPSINEDDLSDDSFQLIYPQLLSLPLHRACALNNCDKILEFIQDEMELNLCDNEGFTPLHYACRFKRVEAVKVLVKQPRIQLDLQNIKNKTPLHLAAIYSRTPAIIKLLIEAGCDVNVKDLSDETALHHIIKNSSDFSVKVEMGRLLLENGFDLEKVDNFSLLNLILKPPEDHIKNADGYSPEFQEYLNFISMFLYYNIDVNCQRNNEERYKGYRTPFEIVLFINEIPAVIDLFMDYVDDFGTKTMQKSYFLQALQCNNNQLFKYFCRNCNLDAVLESDKEFLFKLLIYTDYYPAEDFFETIYMVLESKSAFELLDWSKNNGIYILLLLKFLERRYLREDRLKILYTILSINNEINYMDLQFVYRYYGFNEEFEAFLIVNAQVLNNWPQIDENHICFKILNPQRKLKYTRFPLTLRELSRDAFRANIKCKLSNPDIICLDFYNKIQSMNIPQKIKDVIVLKERLSEVCVQSCSLSFLPRRPERI